CISSSLHPRPPQHRLAPGRPWLIFMGNPAELAMHRSVMSPRRRFRSSSPPPAHKRPSRALRSPVARLALYLCCAAEVVFGFGDAVGSMPWTRLVESIICQRHADGATTNAMVRESGTPPSLYQMLLNMLLIGGRGGLTAEARCKGDVVQAEISEL
ncbi:MAG: hypothetical protein Q9226_006183, partial [Calogaya cf. arnoldii]